MREDPAYALKSPMWEALMHMEWGSIYQAEFLGGDEFDCIQAPIVYVVEEEDLTVERDLFSSRISRSRRCEMIPPTTSASSRGRRSKLTPWAWRLRSRTSCLICSTRRL
jgi:hypothetical protein